MASFRFSVSFSCFSFFLGSNSSEKTDSTDFSKIVQFFHESRISKFNIEYDYTLSFFSIVETMGTLALGNENVQTEEYLTLGLKESGNGNSGNPRVLSLFSTLLERSVQKNERILEATKTKDAITIFHGSRAPSLGIRQYVDRIFKYSRCSPSCFVMAYIYVDRFVQRTNFYLTSLNVHRVIITSVMVAAKFIDDAFFNNAYYARVGGVSTAELNKLEMKFLFGLDFQLHVTLQTFRKYCSVLEKEATDVLQIERSFQACGIKKSWQNKDDSTCAPTIAR